MDFKIREGSAQCTKIEEISLKVDLHIGEERMVADLVSSINIPTLGRDQNQFRPRSIRLTASGSSCGCMEV